MPCLKPPGLLCCFQNTRVFYAMTETPGVATTNFGNSLHTEFPDQEVGPTSRSTCVLRTMLSSGTAASEKGQTESTALVELYDCANCKGSFSREKFAKKFVILKGMQCISCARSQSAYAKWARAKGSEQEFVHGDAQGSAL